MARTLTGPARPPLRWLLGIALLTLLVGGAGGLVPSAHAAVITVTTTQDQFDDSPPCSLREAVASANSDTSVGGCTAGSGADTIVLDGLEYHLRFSPWGIVTDESVGDLDVFTDITIVGQGAGQTFIDGAWTSEGDRIIQLSLGNGFVPRDEGATEQQAQQGPTLVLEDLTVQDGDTGTVPSTDEGGGILVDQGHLITRNVVIDHNSAPDDTGGGLAVFSEGSAELFDTTLIRNLSEGGGAIWNNGSLTMTGGAIGSFAGIRDRWPDRNATNGGNGGGILNTFSADATISDVSIVGNLAFDGDGGGIWNAGTMTVDRSLLFSNHAQSDGGGYYETSVDTLNMTNVTISGNTANDDGGGGFNEAGTVNLTNVTVAFNRADDDNDDDGDGGGIVEQVINTTTLKNTILGGNVDKTIDGNQHHDCSGPMTSLGNNLVQRPQGCTGFVGSDILGHNPGLAPLADNGGPTATHMLRDWSPAIDAASGGPAVDQRTVPRPFGPAPDIGAYERFLCFKQPINSVGTPGNDRIDERGEPPMDVILGLGGNDVIIAGPGKDYVCGGPGKDRILLGGGRDKGAGQGGKDIIRGGGNPDLLKGGAGRDELIGGGTLRDDGDRCVGGKGNDSARGCEQEKSI